MRPRREHVPFDPSALLSELPIARRTSADDDGLEVDAAKGGTGCVAIGRARKTAREAASVRVPYMRGSRWTRWRAGSLSMRRR
jgi:hypothetical protein